MKNKEKDCFTHKIFDNSGGLLLILQYCPKIHEVKEVRYFENGIETEIHSFEVNRALYQEHGFRLIIYFYRGGYDLLFSHDIDLTDIVNKKG